MAGHAEWLLTRRWSREWGDRERGEIPHRRVPRKARRVANDKRLSQVEEGLRRINPTRLSTRTMLPWERAEEYLAIAAALTEEHEPEGPTEEYLVDELAWVLWRKRRLALAETSAFRRGMVGKMASYGGTVDAALGESPGNESREGWVSRAIHTLQTDTSNAVKWDEQAEEMAHRALGLLDSGQAGAYAAAVAALRADVKEGWEWEMDGRQRNWTKSGRATPPMARGFGSSSRKGCCSGARAR